MLRSTLDTLVGEAEEAGPDQPRYGVLVFLYRHRAPVDPGPSGR
ncbi:hypothetical protein [Micromonospora chersina]